MAEKYYSIYAFNNIPSFENGQYPSEFVEKNGVLLLEEAKEIKLDEVIMLLKGIDFFCAYEPMKFKDFD